MERLTHKARYEAGYKLNKGVKECQASDGIGGYEDTGLTPPEIMELKERDTAVLLEDIVANKKDNGRLIFGTCPKCKTRVSNIEGGNFCQNCGQRLKWED